MISKIITSNISSLLEVAGDDAILVNQKNVAEITDAMNIIALLESGTLNT